VAGGVTGLIEFFEENFLEVANAKADDWIGAVF